MIRVPLATLPDTEWVALRRLGYAAAAYGNQCLNEAFARQKGGFVRADKAHTLYKEAGASLAAAVRDSIQYSEVRGMWRRLGRKILRGEQTLGRFSADRALTVRHDAKHRAVGVLRDDSGAIRLSMRLFPEPAPRSEFPVWMPALRKDRRLGDLLAAFALGGRDISKATILFRRPGRKVFVLLAYPADPPTPQAGGVQATLGPIDRDEHGEQLWLRAEGRALSVTNRLCQLRAMKAHYAGIHARLRHGLGKRGRRHDLRRRLQIAGSYTEAARGPLHEWSREIVSWCQRERVGALVWALKDDGTLPWDRLFQMVSYKAAASGIAVSQIVPPAAQDEALRRDLPGDVAELAKKARKRKRSPSATERGGE